MKSSSTLKATFWAQITPGSNYWRLEVPARDLPAKVVHLDFSDLIEDEHGEIIVPRQEGYASVWAYVGNATKALIMVQLQAQGHKVIMEVDDNYLSMPPHVPGTRSDWQIKLDTSSKDTYSYQAHKKIVEWVDGVICSTEPLCDAYEKVTSAPIYHCPNSVDLTDWEKPTRYVGRNIGYAGSDSHQYDLSLVERGMDYAWRQRATRVWKYGAKNVEWKRFKCKTIPWSDNLPDYRKRLQYLDVGLCPLKRSNWHDCKSDIKAMEYLLVGAVPIVQGDSPVYREWVDIVPSASTEKEWLKQIKWACHAPQDELDDVHERGMQHIKKHKLIEQHVDSWEEACT